MGRNLRYAQFPSKGPKKQKEGQRHDEVGPMKTKDWPGLPGKTQPRKLNHGMKPLKHGPADKGI